MATGVPKVVPCLTPDMSSSASASMRILPPRPCPCLRRLRSSSTSLRFKARPAGSPSSTHIWPGPWDSPAVVKRRWDTPYPLYKIGARRCRSTALQHLTIPLSRHFSNSCPVPRIRVSLPCKKVTSCAPASISTTSISPQDVDTISPISRSSYTVPSTSKVTTGVSLITSMDNTLRLWSGVSTSLGCVVEVVPLSVVEVELPVVVVVLVVPPDPVVVVVGGNACCTKGSLLLNVDIESRLTRVVAVCVSASPSARVSLVETTVVSAGSSPPPPMPIQPDSATIPAASNSAKTLRQLDIAERELCIWRLSIDDPSAHGEPLDILVRIYVASRLSCLAQYNLFQSRHLLQSDHETSYALIGIGIAFDAQGSVLHSCRPILWRADWSVRRSDVKGLKPHVLRNQEAHIPKDLRQQGGTCRRLLEWGLQIARTYFQGLI